MAVEEIVYVAEGRGLASVWAEGHPKISFEWGKHSLFRIPLLGPLLRWQGVIAVDRKVPHGIVEQAIAALRGADRMWYAIAPEGTRKWVPHWKPGFWRIAHGAGVPVIPAYFDYPSRTIGVGPVFETTGDMAADIARIQRWYAPFKGRRHDVVQPADAAAAKRP
jgi:1-acyl-sn-glycerol-3-phosphate acyltransferase